MLMAKVRATAGGRTVRPCTSSHDGSSGAKAYPEHGHVAGNPQRKSSEDGKTERHDDQGSGHQANVTTEGEGHHVTEPVGLMVVEEQILEDAQLEALDSAVIAGENAGHVGHGAGTMTNLAKRGGGFGQNTNRFGAQFALRPGSAQWDEAENLKGLLPCY